MTSEDAFLTAHPILQNGKSYEIRPVRDADISTITKLVHLAYQKLADMGLNYTASYQDNLVTRNRIDDGRAWVLTEDHEILGTVLLTERNLSTNRPTLYISQLAVHPALQGTGLGGRLMDFCEQIAVAENYQGIQLDTAKPAKHLVSWYEKLGYVIVGSTKWTEKTYESWILEKALPVWRKESRPDFIKHYLELQSPDDAHYPESCELLSIGSPLGKKLGLTKLGIHHETVPSGRRTSWPHAESTEEEFVYVIEGHPDVWVDGFLHRLNPGDAVGFAPGTGICHTFLNNTANDVRLMVVGEAAKKDNKCFYALHPKRNEEAKAAGWLWENPPRHERGEHNALPVARPPRISETVS